MAQPDFLGDGSTPRRSDALWAIEQKILGALIDGAGGGGGPVVSGCSLAGTGSPEGVLAGIPGCTYVRIDTGGFWYKSTGAGSTGWTEGFA